jgi:hypothetical protein
VRDTFKCDHCGETFDKAWSDEEALAESKELWGELPPEAQSVICDECFKDFQKWANEGSQLQ